MTEQKIGVSTKGHEQVPSIGRVVHFVLAEHMHRPALILYPHDPVEDGKVTLYVFVSFEEGMPFSRQWVAHDEGYAEHTWHWPERT